MTAPTLVNDPWRRQGRTSNQLVSGAGVRLTYGAGVGLGSGAVVGPGSGAEVLRAHIHTHTHSHTHTHTNDIIHMCFT